MPDGSIAEEVRRRRNLVMNLRFLDANMWLGQPEHFPLAAPLDIDELIAVARQRGIVGGLVSHWRGRTLSAQDGNHALLDVTDRLEEDFFAIWTALPMYPAEPGPLPGIDPLPEKVRGVRIFPSAHRYPLTDWMLGSLCSYLIDTALPLFVWHTEIDWPVLYAIARRYPDLNLVIETQPQKILYHTRPLFALMRDCPNTHLELSNVVGPTFVEHAARQFGSERLIFGSFLPVNDPLVAMGMVLDAEIAEDDKAMIAGGALRRLIEGVQA